MFGFLEHGENLVIGDFRRPQQRPGVDAVPCLEQPLFDGDGAEQQFIAEPIVTRLRWAAPFDNRTPGPATRQTSQTLSFAPREGVMLAVTGTRAPSMAGSFSNPTTPRTFCHQAGDWEAISSEDK